MPLTENASTRQEQIAACVAMVAEHFGVRNAMDLVTKSPNIQGPVKECRKLLAYHLHECGMSYKAIGRIWKAGEESTRENARKAALFMAGPKRLLLARLPKITTTLEITHTGVPPVIESRKS